MKKQSGFTLIELVVVIVILGILAVTAAPKFIDLKSDAEDSVVQAMQAAMQSASSMVNAKSIISGNQNEAPATTGGPTVEVNGDTVEIAYGYPSSHPGHAATWGFILDFSADDWGLYFIGGTPNSFVMFPKNKTLDFSGGLPVGDVPTEDVNCIVYYTQPTAVNTFPTINTIDCL